jgi:hypothetical protein
MRHVENFGGMREDVRLAEVRFAPLGCDLFETARERPCRNA